MIFNKLSSKQAEVFKFPHEQYDALICDGAVRSGKTMMMTYSFLLWAMEKFNGVLFAICGKTVQSAERNIIHPLLETKSITDRYAIAYTRSVKLLTIKRADKTNYFYIFGGKDESSYMLIQGLTLSGVLLDEVALMPQSFVEQAITRTLSVDNAKLWFNCNPESPMHWFYLEWILKAKEHNAKHLHFLMEDNPGLSEKALEKAKRDFTGVFYQRYVLGEWVLAEGLVYPNFDADRHIIDELPPEDKGCWWISLDYGIVNPFSAHLWHVVNNVANCVDEYYHNSEGGRKQKTDEEHYAAIERLAGDRLIRHIVVDPSASSFKETIRRHGRYNIRNAENDVIPGIANCMTLLDTEYVKFSPRCKNLQREFGLYSWDANSGKDEVIKENDHAMDDFRYFVQTILRKEFKHIGWGKE